MGHYKKSEQTKKRIIAAAFDLISSDGHKSFTKRALVEKSNIHGIYNHFSCLDEIILEVNKITLDKISSMIKEVILQDLDIKKTISLICYEFLEFSQNHTNLWKLLFIYRVKMDDDLPEWVQNHIQEVFAPIVIFLAKHYQDEVKARDLGAVIWSFMHGLLILKMNNKLVTVTNSNEKKLIDIFIDEIFS